MAARAPMKATKAMKAKKAKTAKKPTKTMKTMKASKARQKTSTPFICDNNVGDMPIKEQSQLIARAWGAWNDIKGGPRVAGQEHMIMIGALLSNGISVSLTRDRSRVPDAHEAIHEWLS